MPDALAPKRSVFESAVWRKPMKASPVQKLSSSTRKFSVAARSTFASCAEFLRAFNLKPQRFAPRRIFTGRYPMKRIFVFLSLVVALVSGCNESNTVTVTLASSSQAVDNGQSVTITVTIKDAKNAGVTWTLSGPGALSNKAATSVTYTAAASGTGTATVTATSVTD